MEYLYLIGDIGFEFSFQKDIIEYSPYDVFRVDRNEFNAADEKHLFRFLNTDYKMPSNSVLIQSTSSVDVYENENEYIHVNKRFDEVDYECIVVSPKNAPGGCFYYTNGGFDKLKVTTELFRSCDFISSLLYYNAIILHCSYIIYNGKAILFSAPSEGGKSTQAALWEKYQGAEIINGDRAVIKKENDGWYVHSLPLCGSSGICKRKSAPLGLIAFLNKSSENSISSLTNAQKLSLLIPQLGFESSKQNDFNKVLSLVDDLINNEKILMLNCRIDSEATEVLKKEVEPVE